MRWKGIDLHRILDDRVNLSFRPRGIVIEPPSAVELLVSVDDRVIRVVIDWATFGRLVDTEIRDSGDVEEFVDTHRSSPSRGQCAIRAPSAGIRPTKEIANEE